MCMPLAIQENILIFDKFILTFEILGVIIVSRRYDYVKNF